eukprot:Hpha_TRINITY_DN14640_c0_g1::TRINITY_DN14640_c0_g1_i1::g.48131::m.48131
MGMRSRDAEQVVEDGKLTLRPTPPQGEKGVEGGKLTLRPTPPQGEKGVQLLHPGFRSETTYSDQTPPQTLPQGLPSPKVEPAEPVRFERSVAGSMVSSVISARGGQVVPGLTYTEKTGPTAAVGVYYGDMAYRVKQGHAAGSAARLVQDRRSSETASPDIRGLLAKRPPLDLETPPPGRLVVQSWAEAMLIARCDARIETDRTERGEGPRRFVFLFPKTDAKKPNRKRRARPPVPVTATIPAAPSSASASRAGSLSGAEPPLLLTDTIPAAPSSASASRVGSLADSLAGSMRLDQKRTCDLWEM